MYTRKHTHTRKHIFQASLGVLLRQKQALTHTHTSIPREMRANPCVSER